MMHHQSSIKIIIPFYFLKTCLDLIELIKMLNISMMSTNNITQCMHFSGIYQMWPEQIHIISHILILDCLEIISLEMKCSLDKWTIVEFVYQQFTLTILMMLKLSEEETSFTTTCWTMKLPNTWIMKSDRIFYN